MMKPTLQECRKFFESQEPLIKRLNKELDNIWIHRFGRTMIFEGTFYETPHDDQVFSRNVVMRAQFDGQGWSLGPIKGELDFGDEGVVEDVVANEPGDDPDASLLKIRGMLNEWKFPESSLEKAKLILNELIQARTQIMAAC